MDAVDSSHVLCKSAPALPKDPLLLINGEELQDPLSRMPELRVATTLQHCSFHENDSRGSPHENTIEKRSSASRSASFSHLPRDHSCMADVAFSAKDVSVKRRVSFQDHTVVIPIESLKDCPLHVRRTLWMTNDEMAFSMHQAMILEMKERRQKKTFQALHQVDQAPTKSEVDIVQAEEDFVEEEDGSFDFLDWASCEGLDVESEKGESENTLNDMNEISLSQ